MDPHRETKSTFAPAGASLKRPAPAAATASCAWKVRNACGRNAKAVAAADPSRFAKTPPQHSIIILASQTILIHLMFQISFWYLSGSLRQPLGASGSPREAFSKVLASVPGSPIPLRGNDSFEPFLGFCGGDIFREAKLYDSLAFYRF